MPRRIIDRDGVYIAHTKRSAFRNGGPERHPHPVELRRGQHGDLAGGLHRQEHRLKRYMYPIIGGGRAAAARRADAGADHLL